jgi:uncharacterized protein (DUF58 family)
MPLTPEKFNRAETLAKADALAFSLPPLAVRASLLASSISLGLHGRHKAGIGQSFWQFHRYRAEDPAASIDWRQSARTQHLYVREREWEAAQSVYLWRDGSASMRFSSGGPSKLERATLLTLSLGILLARAGERIALYGEKDVPGASRATVNRIAHALCDLPPLDTPLPPEAMLPRHAEFVWFGDFLAPLEDIESAIRRLTQKGAGGRLVHIVDPAEEDFPYLGRTRFVSESGDETHLMGRAESVGPAYRRRFRARAETLSLLARNLGWNYSAHRTDRPPKPALIALYADLAARSGPSIGAQG